MVRVVDRAGTGWNAIAGVILLLTALGNFLTATAFAGPTPSGNSPTLTSVSANGSGVLLHGTLSSAPSTTYQLDFYQSATGVGTDAKTYLGSTSATTDASGNTTFYVSLPATVPATAYLIATATDALNNTSDFSTPLEFNPTNAVAISMTLGVSPSPTRVGDQLALTVKLVNASASAATGVVVQDILPAAFQYAYCTASQSTPTSAPVGNNLTWNLGTLAAGGSATLTIYASSQSVGTFTNAASFSQNEYNLNLTANSNQLPVNISAPSAAIINLQPVSQILNLGAVLNLVTGVLGSPNAHYQWRKNGANIPGATNATYNVLSLLVNDGGLYTCVVSDALGATTSDGALISLGGLNALPVADNFASRGTFTLLNSILGILLPESANNLNATSEPGEPMHAGVPGGKSVWFQWTPSPTLLGLGSSGVATISTAGSSFDTLLAVYTGTSLSNLTEVVSDDDAGGYYTSLVSFNVTPGTTYLVAIDGAYGASGQIALSATYTAGGSVPQITAQPTNQIVASNSTATFSVVVAGTGITYQWYRNGATISGATTANLLVKNVQPANVGVYTVQVTKSGVSLVSKPASLEISMLDGAANSNAVAVDKYQAAYTAVLDAAPGIAPAKKTGTVAAFSPANVSPSGGGHSVADAGGTSRGYSSTQVFSTYGGATQSGEPNHCGSAGGNSAWASVQAADNGVMIIDTDGSSFNTVLAIYTGNGNDFSSLQSVACDVGSGQGGTNSLVSFAATSNTVYYIAVDSVNGTAGTVVLNANLTVPPAIVAQPVSQTVSPGATVNLAVSATGHLPPGCQWWHNGGLLTGATNGTLSITNFQSGKCGMYQMVATNTLGAAVTSPVSIFLNTPMRLDSFTFNRTNSSAQLRLIGTAGTSYVIQTSSDLIHWVPLTTNTATTGIWSLNDTNATNSQRYYRAVPGS